MWKLLLLLACLALIGCDGSSSAYRSEADEGATHQAIDNAAEAERNERDYLDRQGGKTARTTRTRSVTDEGASHLGIDHPAGAERNARA